MEIQQYRLKGPLVLDDVSGRDVVRCLIRVESGLLGREDHRYDVRNLYNSMF